jgi:hypothetical protein
MARQNVNDCYVKEFWTASAPLEAERGCFTFSVLEKRETLNRFNASGCQRGLDADTLLRAAMARFEHSIRSTAPFHKWTIYDNSWSGTEKTV